MNPKIWFMNSNQLSSIWALPMEATMKPTLEITWMKNLGIQRNMLLTFPKFLKATKTFFWIGLKWMTMWSHLSADSKCKIYLEMGSLIKMPTFFITSYRAMLSSRDWNFRLKSSLIGSLPLKNKMSKKRMHLKFTKERKTCLKYTSKQKTCLNLRTKIRKSITKRLKIQWNRG